MWPEDRSEGGLGAYVRALRAHPRLIVSIVLAAVAGSVGWLAVRTPTFKATAQVLIAPLPNADDSFLGLPLLRDSGDPTRTIQTAAALLDSPETAGEAARRLGDGWTAKLVMDAVDVQPEGQSNILDVTARGSNSRVAVGLANTFARTAVQLRDAHARVAVSRALAELSAAEKQARTSTALETRISQLQQISVSGDPTTTFARAAVAPQSPAGAPPWLSVALAVLGGALLASAVALVVETVTPRRVRREDDLVAVHPLPILARAPADTSLGAHRRALARPANVRSAFRSLRLQLAFHDGDHRRIVFTSPSHGDGRTSSAVDLALELASTGDGVILLDLDVERPQVAHLLGITPERDLGAVLAPGGQLADALVSVRGVPNLRVVAGTSHADSTTLEALRHRLPDLLAEALSMASYVLIDTSPLAAAGHVLPYLAAVDDVILVARLGHTPLTDVEDARDLLRRMNLRPTGYVVVGGVGKPVSSDYPPLVVGGGVQSPAS
jgi:Mrp family chromosome partitioning ATPase